MDFYLNSPNWTVKLVPDPKISLLAEFTQHESVEHKLNQILFGNGPSDSNQTVKKNTHHNVKNLLD